MQLCQYLTTEIYESLLRISLMVVLLNGLPLLINKFIELNWIYLGT